MTASINDSLADLQQQLDALPEMEEPPPTTLQVLGRSRRETYWQRLLVYFLSPDEAHGLEDAVIEHVLTALSDRSDFDFDFSRLSLDNVQVEREVATGHGRPDIVIWSATDWFICFELKVDSTEGQDQTLRYVSVDAFDEIDLNKNDVPDDGHHYIYLAPEDVAGPDADEFTHISWSWVSSELQSFLSESYGEYPFRTTVQLHDFADTIRSELTMTEYQENQREKVELAIDHYEPMMEVLEALEDHVEDLINRWPDWFIERNPNGWNETWQARVTNNRYKTVYRDEWAHNLIEDSISDSDLFVYWVFEVAESYLGQKELNHEIIITGEDDSLIETFRENFYRDDVQDEIEKILTEISSGSNKTVTVEQWDGHVYESVVSGTYQFEFDDADAFERTAVRAFEDLQPIFEKITDAVPE